ncbi:n-alkane-inducible cytochrome P450 [Arthroderma uncinatum]|uniref:n-alkane-inducible cytochrome P450 n=1 Tax=Arthroderma uncinatum TaxID=74035 RepID=UPI00144AF144|nr:n-alkane-inducible cytochrome P450 [Arthroderma uncinatum]KAF3490783.1 n-alkane-inducible cytochrome P450 [Arthroderma uncinatum]
MEMYSNFQLERVAMLAAGLATIAFISLRIWRLFIHNRFARRHGCQPVARSANKDPFLGLDTIRRGIRAAREHKTLEKSCERFRLYGNTYTSKMFLTPVIVSVEPENIKTALAVNFTDYGIAHRFEVFKPLLGKGIFDTDGDHWAKSRALIRPNFARDQVADLTMFENLISDLFALIPRDGKTVVDLQSLFFRYTTDSATEFLFGESVGSLQKSQSEFGFTVAFNYALNAITTKGMLGPLGVFYRDRKADESNRICREFAEQFVEKAIHAVQPDQEGEEKTNPQTKRQKYIFSHELASRTSDKRRILDELMNVLIAGRDTTASLLSNMFFMLAKHPAIWAKLRAEVASLEGRLPTYTELRNLKYVKFSLRLHPVVPVNDRLAMRDTVLPMGGGKDGLSPVFVPKGTLFSYNVYAMHRRTDLYGADAEVFRPERWEDGRLQPRWGYLPFNGGPRICLGQQYALTEAAYVTVRMAQEFQVLESRDAGPWEESLTLTLCSLNGTKVSVTPA